MQVRLDFKSMVPRQRRQKSLLTLLNAPDLYTASARFCVAFPSKYSPKVYQSTELKRQEIIYLHRNSFVLMWCKTNLIY